MRTPCITITLLFAVLSVLHTSAANAQSPPGDVIVVVGHVFNDANGNLKRDRNERGLAKMTVVSQPADADTSVVDAVAFTDDTGRFEIATRVGERLSVVASAGYKPMRAGGQIVIPQMGEVTFPMYIDKVVINNRVIQAPPAEVNVSPIITVNVAVPEVNIPPANVHVEPADVTVLPVPVRVTQSIQSIALIGAAVVLGSLSLLSAVVVAMAVRNTGRIMRQIANWQASYAAESVQVTDETWRHVAQQLVADCLGPVVQIDSLVAISTVPVPSMRFRATNGHVYAFALGRCGRFGKRVDWTTNPSVSGELRKLWTYFAVMAALPGVLSRRNDWYALDVAPHASVSFHIRKQVQILTSRVLKVTRPTTGQPSTSDIASHVEPDLGKCVLAADDTSASSRPGKVQETTTVNNSASAVDDSCKTGQHLVVEEAIEAPIP